MVDTRTYDGLKYIGDGTQLGNVPTRDLTAEEVIQYGRLALLQSGLYAEKLESMPTPKRAARKAADTAKEQ